MPWQFRTTEFPPHCWNATSLAAPEYVMDVTPPSACWAWRNRRRKFKPVSTRRRASLSGVPSDDLDRREWLPEPSPDQNAFQDAFKFKLVRIAHGEKRLELLLQRT